jgi:hypothetical protein
MARMPTTTLKIRIAGHDDPERFGGAAGTAAVALLSALPFRGDMTMIVAKNAIAKARSLPVAKHSRDGDLNEDDGVMEYVRNQRYTLHSPAFNKYNM